MGIDGTSQNYWEANEKGAPLRSFIRDISCRFVLSAVFFSGLFATC